ncbi:motile sperm domain-containing protein 2-like [Oppia nitens]|uniref:motile sperm domain-containing protein 2-like n=1 Tax=Oppia nitens TaxID=1686743 RepID=UPI0023DBF2D9|nr:motile sperm domain-containing protein 2-like [Oppia nitens]
MDDNNSQKQQSVDEKSTTGELTEKIGRLRTRFLAEAESEPDKYHQIDIDRIRSDDWQLERFLIGHRDEDDEDSQMDKAYDALARAMHWKQTFGIHERQDRYFPREFLEFTKTQCFGRDREGRLIQWEKVCNHRSIGEMSAVTKQFIGHLMEKTDREVGRHGFILVSDTQGSGLGNIDTDQFRFKIELTQYYPEALQLILNVDLPWLLKGVSKVILSFCDQRLKDRTRFISRKELTDYIPADIIPVDMDGERDPKYVIPDCMLPMKQLSHLGFPDKAMQKYYKSFGQTF